MSSSSPANRSKNASITNMIIIIFFNLAQCWLFSPRIQPYYYPYPYPVPASILSGSASNIGSTGLTSVSPPLSGGYIGQSSIGSNPSGYNYNWYNYQNYPNSGVLYPSSGSNTGSSGGYVPAEPFGNSLFPTSSGVTGQPTTSSFFPRTGSLLRSWWTRKFTKFGSLGNSFTGNQYSPYGITSNSPCNGYWASGSNGSPCISSNLCCYPLVIQTNVDSTSRPSYGDSSPSSAVTYPSNGYVYQPSHHGYKTSSHLSSQASDNVDDVVDSNQSS
ncbi:hypothetical protein BLA29_005692 [Euroglyphus maynei]|uniref:Uncharacterized protein n=1 Tax=Euroglyphus maynei TaxID=6958 RepID=A0A1Y3AP42_EURMA|nr:hypothetical protein BLA29_005692 [Euroglyphus maynei]